MLQIMLLIFHSDSRQIQVLKNECLGIVWAGLLKAGCQPSNYYKAMKKYSA